MDAGAVQSDVVHHVIDIRAVDPAALVHVCGGKCVEITWERESNTDPFRYYLKDGTPLELGVGTTYVGIRPESGSSVSFVKEGE